VLFYVQSVLPFSPLCHGCSITQNWAVNAARIVLSACTAQ
jgi:hypothetical protein